MVPAALRAPPAAVLADRHRRDYRGLAVAQMTVVATLCAVLTAVIPVLIGVAQGDHLGLGAGVGTVITIHAIRLASLHPRRAGPAASR